MALHARRSSKPAARCRSPRAASASCRRPWAGRSPYEGRGFAEFPARKGCSISPRGPTSPASSGFSKGSRSGREPRPRRPPRRSRPDSRGGAAQAGALRRRRRRVRVRDGRGIGAGPLVRPGTHRAARQAHGLRGGPQPPVRGGPRVLRRRVAAIRRDPPRRRRRAEPLRGGPAGSGARAVGVGLEGLPGDRGLSPGSQLSGPARGGRGPVERSAASLGPLELERPRRRALHRALRAQRSRGSSGVSRQHSECRGSRRLPRGARERPRLRTSCRGARRRHVRRQRGPDGDSLQPPRHGRPVRLLPGPERASHLVARRLDAGGGVERHRVGQDGRRPRPLQPALTRGLGDSRALEPLGPARGWEPSRRRDGSAGGGGEDPEPLARDPGCGRRFHAGVSDRSLRSVSGGVDGARSGRRGLARQRRRRADRSSRGPLAGARRDMPGKSDSGDRRAPALRARSRRRGGLGLRRRLRRQRLGDRAHRGSRRVPQALGRVLRRGLPQPDRTLPLLRDAAGARGPAGCKESRL